MQSFDVILRNAHVNGAFSCDIGIKRGVISSLSMNLVASEDTEIIECENAIVTPGGIDGHVHLAQDKSPRAQEAGYQCADTSMQSVSIIVSSTATPTNEYPVETGTRSAVAGGTTTVLLFAEQSRGESALEKVDAYHRLAKSQGSYADYGFHIIITDPTTEVLNKELPVLAQQGISSMKLFLTYKHMRISDKDFLRALQKARELGMVALVHAENGDLVDFFTEQLESQGLTDPLYKAIAHPAAAEAEATNRAVTFSSVMDTPLLIVHVSIPESTEIIRRAQSYLKPIFAETCPQYLLLGKSQLAQEHFCGAKFICSPPLRSDPNDVEAIWRGLINGTFTIFSSDHCPYR
jgi:dihydropyrimidinase